MGQVEHGWTPTELHATSPCCGVIITIHDWQAKYVLERTGGWISPRCGSIMDQPGWRPAGDKVVGCGERFPVNIHILLGHALPPPEPE